MTPNSETLAKIASIRAKIADGTVQLSELQEGVRLLREGRLSAAAVSDSARRKKAVAEIPNANDLLGELGEL